MRFKYRLASAFTLVEVLIVVIVLGILATIVVPQFTDASEDAMNSAIDVNEQGDSQPAGVVQIAAWWLSISGYFFRSDDKGE